MALYFLAYTLSFCILTSWLAFTFLDSVQTLEIFIVPFIAFLIANFVEYALHRWPLHNKYKGFEIPFHLHMVHHKAFDEKAYTIKKFADLERIIFPPLVLNLLALFVAPLFSGLAWLFWGKNSALIFFISIMAYYLLMQVIHVICHLDRKHSVTRWFFLSFLWKHHSNHHDSEWAKKYNFNFIIPVADYVFKTKKN